MKFNFVLTLSLVCIANLCLITNSKTLVPSLFIFGDSLVDVGNNNKLPLTLAKANVIPNGVDYPSKKPTGRFSNGFNTADFIAQRLGLGKASPPPYLFLESINMATFKGVNFASGGSGILKSTGSSMIQWIPLRKQVLNFMKVRSSLVSLVGETTIQTLINNSLFTFVIGSNDLFGYSNTSSQTQQDFITSLIIPLRSELMSLYSVGLRRLVFVGTGPLGCTPTRRLKITENKCEQFQNDLSTNFNVEVGSLLANLSSNLQGFSHSLGDTNLIVTEFIENAASYGFNNTDSACCGKGKLRAELPCMFVESFCKDRNEYLFWDLVHPTQKSARMLTDVLFDGPSNFVRPINVGQLLGTR